MFHFHWFYRKFSFKFIYKLNSTSCHQMENNSEQCCTAYMNLASCYEGLDEPVEFLRCSERLLAMRIEIGVAEHICTAYQCVASAHRSNGDLHQVQIVDIYFCFFTYSILSILYANKLIFSKCIIFLFDYDLLFNTC